MLYILLGILAGTFILLLLFSENGAIFGINADSFASIGALSALLLFVSRGFSHRGLSFSKGLRFALIWVLIAVALIIGYALYKG